MNVKLFIENAGKIYSPPVEEGITINWDRKGNPGKLTFTVIKSPDLVFYEGNAVGFKVDGKPVFYGFVFTKEESKDGKIKVTVYDQLRYLKNKDSYILTNRTASEILQMVIADFQLRGGSIADTGWRISKVDADNKALFDIIQSALDETVQNTGRLYVMYDDYGSLTLRNIEEMKLDYLLDAETAQDYDYSSSIDSNTYNRIRLAYDNKEKGTRDMYVAQDGANINAWGVLQYFEKISTPTNGQNKANALLALYDMKTRKLSASKAFGDTRVRAGSSIIAKFDFNDVELMRYMVVDKVQHDFKNNEHTMKLNLIGGEFVA